MKMIIRSILFLLLFFITVSAAYSQTAIIPLDKDNIRTLTKESTIESQLSLDNAIYVIDTNLRFNKQSVFKIPRNSILRFNAGSVSNTILVGTNTRIDAGLVQIFGDNVKIEGTWDVKEAYPEWFGAKADGITDETEYVQKALSLNSSFVVVSRNTRFNLKKLEFNKNTYLVYFADSELSIPHGSKRKSGELVIYSANSSYPAQESGCEVNEMRFEGQWHPAFIADVRKDVHGHDIYLAPDQKDSFARASFQIEDEEIPRASFHYKNNYRGYDLTSGTQIQANRTKIELIGVGRKSWKKVPATYDFIIQKDNNGNEIAGGFLLNLEDNKIIISWSFGKFETGYPLYYASKKSSTVVVGEKRINEGLASLNTTNYKHGWAVGVPAAISDAMFTVGGRLYAVNTDMYGNDFKLSEPGLGFRYYSGLTDKLPRERTLVLEKSESSYRRVIVKNENNSNLGMVGACSAFSKMIVYKGKLVRSSNSYNVESVNKIGNNTGQYYVRFVTPMQSTGYSVSLTTNNPMVYGCVNNETKEGFTIELYVTGTNTPVDPQTGSVHMTCFGGDL